MTPQLPNETKRTRRKHRHATWKGITEIKLPAGQIKKELGLMQRIVTHDILNQLTALHAFLSLTESVENCSDLKRYIRKEQRIADILQMQILFMRDLQKTGKISPAWHDLEDGIRRIIDIMHLSSEVTVAIQGCGFEVYTDPLLASVFYGLTVNSLMYGKTMNAITIRTEESEESLSIVYRDNGCGIGEESKEKIFHEGYGRNTGLGLYLIREILAANQMSIVENGEPGGGAQFVIRVPRGLYRRRSGEKRELL